MPTIKLNAHLSAVLKSAPYVSDAPKDNKTYGRKDGDWVEIDYKEVVEEIEQKVDEIVQTKQDKLTTNNTDTVRLELDNKSNLSSYVLKTPGSLIIEQSDSAEQTRFDGSEEVVFKLPLASVDKAGEVKKAAPVRDSKAITLETLVKDYNKLLQALRDAGIIDVEAVHYNWVTYDGEHLVAYGDDASNLIVY